MSLTPTPYLNPLLLCSNYLLNPLLLPSSVQVGSQMLVADGAMMLEVTEVRRGGVMYVLCVMYDVLCIMCYALCTPL
jgi:hypothetical protein